MYLVAWVSKRGRSVEEGGGLSMASLLLRHCTRSAKLTGLLERERGRGRGGEGRGGEGRGGEGRGGEGEGGLESEALVLASFLGFLQTHECLIEVSFVQS